MEALAKASGKDVHADFGESVNTSEKTKSDIINVISLFALLTLIRTPQMTGDAMEVERAGLKVLYDEFTAEDTELKCIPSYLDDAEAILNCGSRASTVARVVDSTGGEGVVEAATGAKGAGGKKGNGKGGKGKGNSAKGKGKVAGRATGGRGDSNAAGEDADAGAGRGRGRGRGRCKKQAEAAAAEEAVNSEPLPSDAAAVDSSDELLQPPEKKHRSEVHSGSDID